MHSNGTSKLPPGRILMDHAKTSGTPDVVSREFHDSRSIGPDYLSYAFMGPYGTDEIHGCEVCTKDDGSLHMPTNYERLGKRLVINSKSTGNLT